MRKLPGRLLPVLLAACGLPALAGAQAPTRVETTKYTYNTDGALTEIVEQVTEDGRVSTPTFTYFTWDNCTPKEGDASQCILTSANGNLLGYGPVPGDESAWSAHYDVLDRLAQVTNAQRQTAVYRYHPDELLAASLNADAPTSDGLQFYCDQSRHPQVTNIYDRHLGTLSSRYQRIRYLPDGSQQLLVRHRKDVEGVYDPTRQTMNPYRYGPYGGGGEVGVTMGSDGPLYSLGTNPFQYSAELRDPVSGADYLRARWYLPGHQTFLQRDPVPNLNRYGYANGNPIMNHDPSGKKPAKFVRSFVSGMLSGILNPFGGTIENGGTVHFSGRNLVHFWFSNQTFYSSLALEATAILMTPAASDLAADVDIAVGRTSVRGLSVRGGQALRAGPLVRGAIFKENEVPDALVAVSKLKFFGGKLASLGVHHFATPALFTLADAHSRREHHISFAEGYASAVGTSVGFAIQEFAMASAREAVGAMFERARAAYYRRDVRETYFDRNRGNIVGRFRRTALRQEFVSEDIFRATWPRPQTMFRTLGLRGVHGLHDLLFPDDDLMETDLMNISFTSTSTSAPPNNTSQ